MAIVFGFAGYRWRTEVPEFSPILPTRARRLRFPLRLRTSVLEVDIEAHNVTYRLKRGDPVNARHYGKDFTVAMESPVSFDGDYRTTDKV